MTAQSIYIEKKDKYQLNAIQLSTPTSIWFQAFARKIIAVPPQNLKLLKSPWLALWITLWLY